MNVVFMGTPEFAVPSLVKLIENHNVVAVITQPDKASGRGKKIVFSPVKRIALENNIPVFQPNKIRDEEFFEFLKTIDAQLYVVAAYGQIIPKKILDFPKYGSLNVHGSLLPKYRGAAPIHAAIINGEKETGVTIMQMDKGIDTGDMWLKKSFAIEPEDTTSSVLKKMSEIGAKALIETIDLIVNDKIKSEKQNDSISTYAPMISKELGKIDWNKNSQQINNLIRGANPAYCFYNKEMLKIWEAKIIIENNDFNNIDFTRDIFNGFNDELKVKLGNGETEEKGQIIAVCSKKGVFVRTGDGIISLEMVQGVGGKCMNITDYIRGHQMFEKSLLE